MKTKLTCMITLALAIAASAHAGSATWSLKPTSGDWNTAENWDPATVPNGSSDIATFAVSTHAAVNLSSFVEVSDIIFNPGASAFTIRVPSRIGLTVSGGGITNESGVTQNFLLTSDFGNIAMRNSATIDDMTAFTLTGGRGVDYSGGDITFWDTSTAGRGTYVVGGAEAFGASGASIFFNDNSSAENGSFSILPGGPNLEGGIINFQFNSTAANGTFIVEGGSAPLQAGGFVLFDSIDGYKTTAAGAVFIINGASAENAGGGVVDFAVGNATAGNATLIANPGTNGGDGGAIIFQDNPDGGTARIELFGNGTLDISRFFSGFVSTGSIEGDGLVVLGSKNLILGANNLSTKFSGLIQGAGSVEKIGDGSFTLTSENTYTGGTTVSQGTLVVTNKTGSATGTGGLAVNAGTLGGSGMVTGAVTLGTGSGAGAYLAPAASSKAPTTFTTSNSLVFNPDATYIYRVLQTRRGKFRGDKAVANGVTINSASFIFRPRISGTLPTGAVFVAISNTSASPINGTFSNLPDGGIVTVNGNSFQASYEGGDGNDLTLTVVP
jgi:autotransporter-associated beta strand protein